MPHCAPVCFVVLPKRSVGLGGWPFPCPCPALSIYAKLPAISLSPFFIITRATTNNIPQAPIAAARLCPPSASTGLAPHSPRSAHVRCDIQPEARAPLAINGLSLSPFLIPPATCSTSAGLSRHCHPQVSPSTTLLLRVSRSIISQAPSTSTSA